MRDSMNGHVSRRTFVAAAAAAAALRAKAADAQPAPIKIGVVFS